MLSILKCLNPYKAAGIDNLSDKSLKDGAHDGAQPITQLCNLSIKLNSFPRSCKIAKVKPLFKKGSKTDPQNYRPISLLPLLSKIIERIVHDQTEEFLSKNKITNYSSPAMWHSSRIYFRSTLVSTLHKWLASSCCQ